MMGTGTQPEVISSRPIHTPLPMPSVRDMHMPLTCALNDPLHFLLYGDWAAPGPAQARCSAAQAVRPCKRTWSAANFDVIENRAAYEFIADTPGFSSSDISVELRDKVLTISGQQQQELGGQKLKKQRHEQQQHEGERKQQQQQQQQQVAEPEAEVKVLRSERCLRQFRRSFELPDDANTEDVSASLDKGVLTVRVAKLAPTPKPERRRIPVQSAALPAL